LKVLDNAIKGFERAGSDDARRMSFARINRAAHNLELTEPFQKMQQENRESLRQKVSEVYKAQLIDPKDTTGWARFRLSLKDSGKK
jgi:hypothetical protein